MERIPMLHQIQPEITISDLAALKQSEDEPAQDFITRFRKLKMKCRIPMEERHFIQMAQATLKISLRKRFDGMLLGDLAELADKASKYEELLREEQQKRNSSKGTYYKSPIHLVQIESEEEAEYSEEGEVAVAEMAKLKHPISCKALTKPPKDQKPPPFTGGDVIQEGITAERLKLAEKSPTVTTDPFPQPQVNMVNLNWPEQKRTRSTAEASSSRGRMVSKETNEMPKATISAGMVLCSRCKCEAELAVVLNRQSQPMPSVFDRIGTSSRDRARQGKYPRPAQHNRRMTEQPKKEISIKMLGDDKPLATIIEGRWYAVGKSGRPTMELTITQKRRIQRQYCTFLTKGEDEFEKNSGLQKDKKALWKEIHRTALFLQTNQGDGKSPQGLVYNSKFWGCSFGSKKLKIAFFVVDTTSTTYNALLGRDWIHQSLCVPSTLHQQLALWNEEGYMEIVEADPRPFLPSAMCFEARYYHDDLGPFTFLGVNQNGRPHGVTAQRLIEDGLASSLEDWNRPFILKLQNSDV
ncbi:unnamed protein product [Prunus brigantina]